MAAEKEKIVRSRTVSFRDIHIAKVTTNTEIEYAAETPSKLAGDHEPLTEGGWS